MHLAELNVGKCRYPMDYRRMAEFMDNLDRVNAIGPSHEAFGWKEFMDEQRMRALRCA